MSKKKDIQRVEQLAPQQDPGDAPVGPLTAAAMVEDYIGEKYPDGHSQVTLTGDLVEVHGTNHVFNDKLTNKLASGQFDVKKQDLAVPKRKQVWGWLERAQVRALGQGDVDLYDALKRAKSNVQRAERRKLKAPR